MNRFYLMLCTLLLSIAPLRAQEIKVSGSVTSGGESLPGVTISVKDKPTHGTMTDADGKFELSVDAKSTLVFKYLGFQDHEEAVKNRTQIHVKLQESDYLLDDIIITVPYGTAKKSTFTGSAGIVDGGIIEKSQVSNVTKALQGTIAGVQSFSASGQPGSDATIRIRGIGSVNASSDPLYVVDGVPYDGSLSAISSSDIASITVMKDAASATLYGSRAANGVVMITTKQGSKNGKPEVEFTVKYGFSDRARSDYKQMNTKQNFELYWEALRNGNYDNQMGQKVPPTPEAALAAANQYASANIVNKMGINPYGKSNAQPIGLDGKLVAGLRPLWNDDWNDELSQNAHYTDINVRVSGGGENSRYYFSGGYLNDQGIVIESGFKRYNLRANIVSDVKKWLQVGLNVSGSHSVQKFPKQDDSTISNVILFGRSVPGFYPVYKRDPETGAYVVEKDDLTNKKGNKAYDFGDYRATSFSGYNLLATLPMDKNERKRDAASIRAYVQVEPIKDLTFKTSLNVDYYNRTDHNYTNPDWGKAAASDKGSVYRSSNRTVGMTINNVINYTRDINKDHNIRVLAGQEYYQYTGDNFDASRSRIVKAGMEHPDAAAKLEGFEGKGDKYKLLSFFGSAEYSFLKRYYFSTSVRADGSSRFHKDNRWGTFWSVGASWRAIDEPFMERAKGSFLSNLSLRTSYGAQGNDNLNDYYAYQELYSMMHNLGEPGLIADRLGTPKLSWETNLNLNVGLDFGFFNNRLSGSIEFFERRSKDLLFARDLAPSLGIEAINENVGTVKNYGWEFLIEGYPIHTENWKWKLSLNATTYKNKIVSLPSKGMWNGSKKWVEGGSLYDFYMIEWAGVNPENGNPQWYLYDDNGQKIISEEWKNDSKSKIKAGSSLPDLSGGFSTSLAFKGLEFSALFAYNIGGKIYNRDKLSLQHQGSPGKTWSKDMLDRWTPENTKTNIPRLTTNPNSSWTNESTRFLVNRSYLRLKTVTLSYSLPRKWVNVAMLKNVNVFVQAENLLTLTKEQGLDPEQTFDGTTYYRYPAMRTISFGLNVKL